jgi:hypothetical protein
MNNLKVIFAMTIFLSTINSFAKNHQKIGASFDLRTIFYKSTKNFKPLEFEARESDITLEYETDSKPFNAYFKLNIDWQGHIKIKDSALGYSFNKDIHALIGIQQPGDLEHYGSFHKFSWPEETPGIKLLYDHYWGKTNKVSNQIVVGNSDPLFKNDEEDDFNLNDGKHIALKSDVNIDNYKLILVWAKQINKRNPKGSPKYIINNDTKTLNNDFYTYGDAQFFGLSLGLHQDHLKMGGWFGLKKANGLKEKHFGSGIQLNSKYFDYTGIRSYGDSLNSSIAYDILNKNNNSLKTLTLSGGYEYKNMAINLIWSSLKGDLYNNDLFQKKLAVNTPDYHSLEMQIKYTY